MFVVNGSAIFGEVRPDVFRLFKSLGGEMSRARLEGMSIAVESRVRRSTVSYCLKNRRFITLASAFRGDLWSNVQLQVVVNEMCHFGEGACTKEASF
jgi:hypothetical protein